jgi:hypothetical protein
MSKPRLTKADFVRAAAKLDVPIATIQAVAEVEARGSGFLPDGQPKILFEAHVFHRLTGGIFTVRHPDISSPRWDRKLYKGGAAEHDRLAEAVKLNRERALESASWGVFQIMGFNWKACGYGSLQEFINAMFQSEGDHLDAFVGFIRTSKLDTQLRQQNWAGFARSYNGPKYKENQYDLKIKRAFEKHSRASGS